MIHSRPNTDATVNSNSAQKLFNIKQLNKNLIDLLNAYMSTTYTIRIPDHGSVNTLLPSVAFLGSLVFALSPSCLCRIPTTDRTLDGAAAFPKCNDYQP